MSRRLANRTALRNGKRSQKDMFHRLASRTALRNGKRSREDMSHRLATRMTKQGRKDMRHRRTNRTQASLRRDRAMGTQETEIRHRCALNVASARPIPRPRSSSNRTRAPMVCQRKLASAAGHPPVSPKARRIRGPRGRRLFQGRKTNGIASPASPCRRTGRSLAAIPKFQRWDEVQNCCAKKDAGGGAMVRP